MMKIPPISLSVDDVLIAPLQADDAPELAAITDASITQRIDFLPAEFGLADAQLLIAQMTDQNVHHAVRQKSDGKLLGVIGVHVRHGADGPAFETGYWFAAEARGRGLAGRCVSAVVRHLVGVAAGCAVVAECAPANRRSWALLHRIGFHSLGVNGQRTGRRLLQWAGVAGQRIDVC
jgi:RimJ/RimL family protein N-acetyltransferase